MLTNAIDLDKNSYLRTSSYTPLPSTWQAMRRAAKVRANKGKIRQYAARLEALRNAVSFHIIVSLKGASEQWFQHTTDKLGSLRDDMKA